MIIILVFVIFALIIIWVFNFNFGLPDFTPLPATSPVSQPPIDIDTDFFKDPRYQERQSYGQPPIVPQDRGRENPFEPY